MIEEQTDEEEKWMRFEEAQEKANNLKRSDSMVESIMISEIDTDSQTKVIMDLQF